MLCHEGLISLIAFIGSIIGFLTPAFSLLLIYDVVLDSILNASIYVGGALVLYGIICFVSYILNVEADHEVNHYFHISSNSNNTRWSNDAHASFHR